MHHHTRTPGNGPSRWRRAGAVLAGLALLGVTTPASAQTLTWSRVPSPNPSIHVNFLQDVSCTSATACTAVGTYNVNRVPRTLIESRNGASWSVVPSPDPGSTENSLNGVSCSSATACTAVGSEDNAGQDSTLIESWDGTSWSVVPSPSPQYLPLLDSVSCVSATMCMAVGYDATESGGYPDANLIESWNGTSWSVVPSPDPGNADDALTGVSCVSATFCTAVGYYKTSLSNETHILVESWDGTSWSAVPVADPGTLNVLSAVSCASATACMAVGQESNSETLTASWNGTKWSAVAGRPGVKHSTSLSGVSCASPTACIAVGVDRVSGSATALIKSWDGTSWSRVASDSPGRNALLFGVSCASASACTAVGNRSNWRHRLLTFIDSGTAAG